VTHATDATTMAIQIAQGTPKNEARPSAWTVSLWKTILVSER
jgi:hypothetical protein